MDLGQSVLKRCGMEKEETRHFCSDIAIFIFLMSVKVCTVRTFFIHASDVDLLAAA